MTNLILLIGLIFLFTIIALGTLWKPAFGLATLLFALPILGQGYRLFIGNQMPFPSLETIAVMLLWIFVQLYNLLHKPHNQKDWGLNIAIFIFLSFGFLSSLFGYNSEFSYKILLTGGLTPLLCFFIARQHINSRANVKLLFLGYFGLVIQTAIFLLLAVDRRQTIAPQIVGLAEWYYYKVNPTAMFGSPSGTISVLIGSIPLVSWYRLYGQWNKNFIWGAILFSTIVGALMSLSRGSWVAVICAMIASLPLYYKKIRIRSLFLFVAIILGSYYFGVFDLFLQMLNFRLGTSVDTINIRWINFQLAVESASKHYLLGLGLGNYSYVYQEFPYALASQFPYLKFAHNLFLTLIPEIGLLGMLAFTYIFLATLFKGKHLLGRITSDEDYWLIYSLVIAIISYIVLSVTSGTHLIATFTDYLIAPALIVTFTFIGIISGIDPTNFSFGSN